MTHSPVFSNAPPEEIIGKNEADFLPEDLVAEHQKKLDQVLRTNQVLNIEEKLETPEGDHWFETRLVSLPVPDGRPQSVLGISRNITAHKKLEQELKNAVDQLNERQMELNALLKSTQAVSKQVGFLETARTIYNECKNMIGANAGYVALLNEDAQENDLLFLDAGGLECTVDPGAPMPVRGLRAEAYRTGQPAWDNAFESSEWKRFLPGGHVTLENVLFVPIMIDGQARGLIGLANKPGGFTAQDVKRIDAFAELTGLALQGTQVRDTLEKSEALFRTSFEESGAGIALLSPEGLVIKANASLVKMLGYTIEELTGLEQEQFGFSEDISARRDVFARLIAGSLEEKHLERRYRHKKNTEVWCIETWSTVTSADGRALYAVLQVQDITLRHTAEADLQQLTATLEEKIKERTYQLNVLNGFYSELGLAPNFEELFRLMMDNLEKVIQYDVAASLVKTGRNYNLYYKSPHKLSENLQQTIKSRLIRTYKMLDHADPDVNGDVLIRVMGEPRTELATHFLDDVQSVFQVPLILSEQNQVAGILFIGSIGDNQYSEDQIQLFYSVANQVSESITRLQKQLNREQTQLVSIVENLPYGVVLLDDHNRILMMNSSAVAPLTQLSHAKHGQVLDRLNGVTINEIFDSKAVGHEVVKIQQKGPSAKVFEIMGRRLVSGTMEGGAILSLRDITEASQLEDRVQQQERLAAVGQLAAGIAHDFNNLLTTIGGYSSMIASDAHATPENMERAQVIREQVRRAAKLIRQILDFSRKSLTSRYPLDLKSFLKESLNMLKRTIKESVDIDFQFSAGEYVVKADPVGLQQVITNLTINAQDAMPEGGELSFSLALLSFEEHEKRPHPDMPAGDWIRLIVSDTGQGIPEEYLSQVFNPFFTTKPVGEGTGLGLSQALGIVDSHGGFIDLKSRIGQGTTFTIYLPSNRQEKVEAAEKTKTQIPRGQGECILLVEDEVAVLKMAKRMLEQIGYQVMTAGNGLEALELYRKHAKEIAVVMTDMVMPKMSGRELILSLKSLNPLIKIIVWTGYPLDGSEDLLKSKIVDWIMKPPDIEILARKLRNAIE